MPTNFSRTFTASLTPCRHHRPTSYWLNWAPTAGLPDMAYTVEDRTYLAFYGGWLDDGDAVATTRWARDNAAAMGVSVDRGPVRR